LSMLRSVKVRDYMTTHLITFHPDTDLFAAIDILLGNSISGAPVVDSKGKLVGILSELDCLKNIVNGSYYDYESLGGTVAEFMVANVETISPDIDILTIGDRFMNEGRRRFPVVEDGKLLGQISRKDILRAVRDFVGTGQINKKKAKNTA
jgi:CBS domain-containing protein